MQKIMIKKSIFFLIVFGNIYSSSILPPALELIAQNIGQSVRGWQHVRISEYSWNTALNELIFCSNRMDPKILQRIGTKMLIFGYSKGFSTRPDLGKFYDRIKRGHLRRTSDFFNDTSRMQAHRRLLRMILNAGKHFQVEQKKFHHDLIIKLMNSNRV